jgi:hypothetical protein
MDNQPARPFDQRARHDQLAALIEFDQMGVEFRDFARRGLSGIEWRNIR